MFKIILSKIHNLIEFGDETLSNNKTIPNSEVQETFYEKPE